MPYANINNRKEDRAMTAVLSTKKIVFTCGIKPVWDVVTSLTDYGWRSDISRIEILSDKQFIEYTKEGYATTFTITVTEPYKRWEFDMENGNMEGHWTGVFAEKDSRGEMTMTETVTAKKWFMKPFVKGYLNKQQERYAADLQKALSESS